MPKFKGRLFWASWTFDSKLLIILAVVWVLLDFKKEKPVFSLPFSLNKLSNAKIGSWELAWTLTSSGKTTLR